MATTYTLEIGDSVTPEDKGGPRVGIGCFATVERATDGPVGISILRGEGIDPVTFTYPVRTQWYTLEANTPTRITLATIDLPAVLPDDTARLYQMKIATPDAEDITVTDAFISTEPHAPAGTS